LGTPLFVMLVAPGTGSKEEPYVDVCVAKPVRPSKLLRTLADAWVRRQEGGMPIDQASLKALEQSIAPGQPTGGPRVLAVEDNPVNQRVATRLLQRLGASVDIAGDGREALKMLHITPYDFVLMDCQMPEMDGYETTRQLRGTPGPNRNVTVIALTADAIRGSRERCMEAGMNNFISKPVKLGDLRQALSGAGVAISQ